MGWDNGELSEALWLNRAAAGSYLQLHVTMHDMSTGPLYRLIFQVGYLDFY